MGCERGAAYRYTDRWRIACEFFRRGKRIQVIDRLHQWTTHFDAMPVVLGTVGIVQSLRETRMRSRSRVEQRNEGIL